MRAHYYRFLFSILAVTMMLALCGCGGGQRASDDIGYVIAGGTEAIDSVLSANSGRWVLVNVWATWCRPCVAETPDLIEFAHRMADRPLQMLGLSADRFTDDDTTAIRKVTEFQHKHFVPYPNLVFLGTVDALTEYLDLSGALPTTILFDPEGHPVQHFVGKLEREQFEIIKKQVG